MKVLLLNPPFKENFSRQSRSPGVSFGGTVYYPYYLAYATGVLDKAGFDEFLIDPIAEKRDHKRTLKEIKSIDPKLIIMDTSTPSIKNDLRFAKQIKKNNPDIHINMVGTHPTAKPEWTLNFNDAVDSICSGEYDYTVKDLAESLNNQNKNFREIKGLAFKKDGEVINTGEREMIKDLDELPFVSKVYKKHLNPENYFYASVGYPQVTILTARGCKYNCSFCNIPFKNSYRTRSPENVIKEFEFIEEEMPEINEVMIEDDTFGLEKDTAMEFCEKKIENNINLPWSCNLRVNTDPKLMEKMKKAGCRLACVGFETPSKESLKNIRKGITTNKAEKFMNKAREIGLLINGCFIIGLFDDTEESIKNTVEYAKELFPDTAQFYPLMVYPRTDDYKKAKKEGNLKTEDYSEWLTEEGHYITTLNQGNLNPSEIRELQKKAYIHYHTSPKYIAYKFIQSIKRPSEFIRNIKGLRSFLKQLFIK